MKLEYYLCFHDDWKLIKDKTQVSAGHFTQSIWGLVYILPVLGNIISSDSTLT